MEFPGGWELVLIVVAGVALFGSKRLPDSARAIGRSLRILKAETKGLRDDDLPAPAPEPISALPPVQPVAQQAVQPTAVQPTAVQPTAVQPTAVQPTISQPSASQPSASQPSAGPQGTD
ncbi:MAG: twin-arginine translocase TatA/TatE family subunit, partial [Actinomycetota bacterium]|nr:twin-arginine translocase TatA/TatE family subunit [Actinomycetota bacterium]